MTIRRILCAWLLCTLLGAAAEPQPEMRIYDVSEFTAGVVWRMCTPDPTAAGEQRQEVTTAVLQEMIKTRVRPDSWDPAKGTSIEERAGMLVIMQTNEVHAIIADLLTKLRKDKTQIAIKGLVLAATDVPTETQFSNDALAKLLGPKGMAGALAMPRIVCYDQQRCAVQSVHEFSYIADQTAEGVLAVPKIATVMEGCILDVCPHLSHDRRLVTVDLRFTVTQPAEQIDSRKLTPMLGGAEKGAQNSGIPVDTLTLPMMRVRSQVRIPAGDWVLAGTMPNPDAAAKEKNLLFFLSAGVVDAPTVHVAPTEFVPKINTAADDKKIATGQLRIFDVRDMTGNITDFPGPRMTLRAENETTVESRLPPSGQIQDVDLAALIKDKLFAGEFADPAFTIDVSNGKLVVFQTPRIQEAIACFLDDVRKKFMPQIAVKACLVSTAQPPEQTLFDSEAFKQITTAEGNAVVVSPSLICANKQLAHVLAARQHSYSKTVSAGEAGYIPVIDSILEGCMLEARPILGFDRTTVRLDIRFGMNSDVTKTKRTIGLSNGATFELDNVALQSCLVQTQLAVPRGKWILAATFSNANPKGPKNMLLFVSADR